MDVYTFGTWLRHRRRSFDWTQAELAHRVNCTAAMIRKLEADERRPSPQLAGLLAEALCVPAAERAAFLRAARHGGAVEHLLSEDLTPLAERTPHNLPAPLTSFIGREHELAEAQRCWQQATRGEGRVLLISGEAGVGKTRLAHELLRQAQASDAAVLSGECFAEGAAPYAPLAEAIAAVDLSRVPPSIIADLLTIAPTLRTTYPDIPPNLPLEPQAERQRIFDNVAAFFVLLSERAPVLLFVEDVHWADSGSLFLLHHLARRVRRRRVLVVLTHRDVDVSDARALYELLLDLNRERLATRLQLSRFDRDQTRDLLAELFQEAITPEFLDGIYAETDGNPFFVEEVCKALIESGKVYRDGEQWRRPSMDQIEIPASVRAAIELRVAKLPVPTQDTLRAAAILGREFEFDVLHAMDGLTEDALIDALEIAERARLIAEIERAGATAFTFVHALLPLALQDGLSALRRQRLHRRAAQALEQVYAERRGEFATQIGKQYAAAGEGEKAVPYLLQAGDRAREVYAYPEAIDQYQRALAFLKARGPGGLTQAARTAMALGQLHHTLFQFDLAQQAHNEAFDLWQRAQDAQAAHPLPPAPHALRRDWPDFDTLNLHMSNNMSAGAISEQLFSGLVELTPDLDLAPDLARRWEMFEDGRRYVFHLRPDARWSDGAPVTAHDFEYAWKRALNPSTRSPNVEYLLGLRGARDYHDDRTAAETVGVTALDEVTLVVELEEPIGHFLHLLANCYTFAIPRHVVEAYGEDWSRPEHIVTNGPFRLETWRPGETVVLVRNAAYHGRFGGNLLRVELDLWKESGDPLAPYEQDHHDVSSIAPGMHQQAQRRHPQEYATASAADTHYVVFDTRRPPFDDVRVRQALAHALDRTALASIVLSDVVLPATGGLVPPVLPGHSPGIGLAYDPARARRLLAEAGYPDGQGFPAIEAWESLNSFYRFSPLFDFLTTQWHDQLGIQVNWKHTERVEDFKRLRAEPPPIYYAGWLADYPDPDNFLRVAIHLPDMHIHWRHPDYEQLLETARRSADQAERLKFYAAADRLLMQEAPIIPLTYGRRHFLLKPWVKRYPLSPSTDWYWKDVIIEAH